MRHCFMAFFVTRYIIWLFCSYKASRFVHLNYTCANDALSDQVLDLCNSHKFAGMQEDIWADPFPYRKVVGSNDLRADWRTLVFMD